MGTSHQIKDRSKKCRERINSSNKWGTESSESSFNLTLHALQYECWMLCWVSNTKLRVSESDG